MKQISGHKKLSEWRLSQQLTRKQLANAVGCSLSYITKLERNERQPGLELGVAIERLTEGVVTAASFVEFES